MSGSVWDTIVQIYKNEMGEPDPRTVKWNMISSPLPTFTLISSYIFFAKVLGPAIMRDRKPFELRGPMIFYNFFMVSITLYYLVESALLTYLKDYTLIGCTMIDRSTNPEAMRLAQIGWIAFIFRFVEFHDTVFFVLRKKFSHITALHLFHHSALPLFGYLSVLYQPGGHSALPVFLNGIVHVIMYSYYGLAAIGPHMQKYLWWKRYLTLLQMAQFLIVFLHTSQLLFIPCHLKRLHIGLILIFSGVFFLLFLNFYIHEYKLRNKKLKADEAASNGQQEAKKLTNGHSEKNGSTTYRRKIESNGHN